MLKLFWHQFLHLVGKIVESIPRPLTIQGNYDGYPVIINPPALWVMWHFGPPCALVCTNAWTKDPMICINKQALHLPPEILEGLLAHECGHIESGHLNEKEIFVHELEADRWALEKHGEQYIKTMEYLGKWHDSEEYQMRIKTVREIYRFMERGKTEKYNIKCDCGKCSRICDARTK